MKSQFDNLGKDPQGNEIIAATDSAGPQVIVKGEEVHLLSRPLKNHAEAVELGNKVVARGVEVYEGWMDLKNGGIGMGLFAVFGGCFRGGYIDEERLAEDAEKITAGHELRRRMGKEDPFREGATDGK